MFDTGLEMRGKQYCWTLNHISYQFFPYQIFSGMLIGKTVFYAMEYYTIYAWIFLLGCGIFDGKS